MNLKSLFFSFSGRINRAKYWLAYFAWTLIAVAAYFALKVVLVAAGLDNPTAMFFGVGLLIFLPSMVAAIAVMLKRLHDRNKGVGWLAFYLLVPVALMLLIYAIAGNQIDESDVARSLQFLVLGVHVAMLVDLGVLRGTAGDNQYGPDPLAKG